MNEEAFGYTTPSGESTASSKSPFFTRSIRSVDTHQITTIPPRNRSKTTNIIPLKIPKREGFKWDILVDQNTARKYQCPMCNKLLKKAVILACSNHKDLNDQYAYCEDCFIAYLATHNNICPLLNKPQPHFCSYIPAEKLRFLVDNLIVTCLHSYPNAGEVNRGCSWVGPLGELDAHIILECRHKEIHCEYYHMGCQMAVKENAIQQHKSDYMEQHLDMIKTEFETLFTQHSMLSTTLKTKEEQIDTLMKAVHVLSDKLRTTVNDVLKLKQKLYSLETRPVRQSSMNSLASASLSSLPCLTHPNSYSDSLSQLQRSLSSTPHIRKPPPISIASISDLSTSGPSLVAKGITIKSPSMVTPPKVVQQQQRRKSNSLDNLPYIDSLSNITYSTHWSDKFKSETIEVSSMNENGPPTRALSYSEGKSVRAAHPLPTNSSVPLVWKIKFTEAEMDCGFFIGVVSDQTTEFETSALVGDFVDAFGISDVDGNAYINGNKVERCEWKPPIYSGDTITINFEPSTMRLLFSLNDEPMLCDESKKETMESNESLPFSIQMPTNYDRFWFPSVSFGKFWGNQSIECQLLF